MLGDAQVYTGLALFLVSENIILNVIKVDPKEGKKQYWNRNKMMKHFYKIMWMKQFTDLKWQLTIIFLVWILVYLKRLHCNRGKKVKVHIS